MSAKCTEGRILALEEIYDELDLDGLQMDVVRAVGLDWADEVNSAVAALDCEIRETIRDMRSEAGS